jgi:hypothetical protein
LLNSDLSAGYGLFGHQAPVFADSYGYNVPVNSGVFQQMLLQATTPLFGVDGAFAFAHPELHIQVSRSFVQDIALE